MDQVPQTLDFLRTVLQQGALYSILVLGLVFTFKVVRFPDLTVDGSFVLGAAVVANWISYQAGMLGGRAAWLAPLLGTIGAFLAGAVAGTVTGALHIKAKINKILCGILVMTMLYTANLRVMHRSNISLGSESSTLFSLLHLSGWGQALAITIFALLLYFTAAYLLKTPFGLFLRATGENPNLVYSLGRDSNRFVLFALALSNALIALSGSLVAQDNGSADINMGLGVLIIGLASLFLGETVALIFSRFCRNFNSAIRVLFAAALGSLLYFLVRSGALRLGLNPTDFKFFTGLIIIIVLSLPLRNRSQPFEESLI